jgi:hypothetical protein
MCTDVKCALNITEEFKELTYEDNILFHKKALKIIYFLSSVMSRKNHFFFYNVESYMVTKLMLYVAN